MKYTLTNLVLNQLNKTFEIARWEFVEKLKRKSFLISLFVTPILFISLGLLPTIFAKSESDKPIIVFVKNESLISSSKVFTELNQLNSPSRIPSYIFSEPVKEQIKIDNYATAENLFKESEIDVYLVLQEDYKTLFYKKLKTSSVHVYKIKKVLDKVILKEKAIKVNLDKTIADDILKENDFKVIQISKTNKSTVSVFLTSYILIMVLIMMILTSGGMMVRGLMEEKSNRIIEILLSSCSGKQILTGKVIGLGSLGLFQLLLWGLIALALDKIDMLPFLESEYLFLQMIYFLLGYIFYSSIFIGIAGIVSTEQAAQQFTSYLTILLVLPIILSLQVIDNPTSLISKLFSYIPLTTAPFMMLRTNIYLPDIWEILISIFILLFSIVITIKISSKVFKVGILYHGGIPKYSELKKWLSDN